MTVPAQNAVTETAVADTALAVVAVAAFAVTTAVETKGVRTVTATERFLFVCCGPAIGASHSAPLIQGDVGTRCRIGVENSVDDREEVEQPPLR